MMPTHNNNSKDNTKRYTPLYRRCDNNDETKGRHLVANKGIPHGTLIFVERPLVALQSLGNPVWVCHSCKAFVGGPSAALGILADRTFPDTSSQLEEQREEDKSWKTVPCRQGCGQVYCSKECEQDFWEARHQYLCTGDIAGSSSSATIEIEPDSDPQEEHPLIQFKKKAVTTNEIFLLVAEWIVAEYSLAQQQKMQQQDNDNNSPPFQEEDVFLSATNNPYEDFLMEPWWDVESAKDSGNGNAKDNNDKNTKDILKRLCNEASQFWKEHWKTMIEASNNDDNDDDNQRCSPLHMANIIGACELNAMGIRRRNPLCRDIFLKELRQERKRELLKCLEQAGMLSTDPGDDDEEEEEEEEEKEGNDDKEEHSPKRTDGEEDKDDGYSDDDLAGFLAGLDIFEEDRVQRAREAPSPDNDNDKDKDNIDNAQNDNGNCEEEGCNDLNHNDDQDDLDILFSPLDGTAMYALCCKMNHSCDPNVVVLYKSGGWGPLYPLVAHCVALRDIQENEELCISYITSDDPLEKRQEALAHYGFTCRCSKCEREQAAENGDGVSTTVKPETLMNGDGVGDNNNPDSDFLFGSDDDSDDADNDSNEGNKGDATTEELENDSVDGEVVLERCLNDLDTVLNKSTMGSIPVAYMAQASTFVIQIAKSAQKDKLLGDQGKTVPDLLEQCVVSVRERDYVLAKTVAPDLEGVLFHRLKKESKWPSVAYREAFWCAAITAAVGYAHEWGFLKAMRYLDKALILGLDRSLVDDFYSYVEYHASRAAVGPCLPVLPMECIPDYTLAYTKDLLNEKGLSKPIVYPIHERAGTDHDIQASHISKSKPIVVRRYAKDWHALRKWRYYGHRVVPIEVGSMKSESGMKEELMTMRDFATRYLSPSAGHECWTLQDAATLQSKIAYLAQHPLIKQLPELGDDIDLQPSLCGTLGPSHVYLWIGTGGTRTPLHFDSYSNIFVQVVGVKYIRIYGEEETPKLYVSRKASYGLQGNMSDVDCEQEEFDLLPLARDAKYQEAILFPGDALFIPARAWHYVRSLTTSISVNFWF